VVSAPDIDAPSAGYGAALALAELHVAAEHEHTARAEEAAAVSVDSALMRTLASLALDDARRWLRAAEAERDLIAAALGGEVRR
jgi:hypothetical protein